MKISERWLREFVDPPADASAIADKLNLAGLETEAEPLMTDAPRGVVVGRILKAEPHPDAERLRVCDVDIGSGTPARIVCGAANARVGLCAPTAVPGAVLPGGKAIERAVLRGVESAGMLCSASELGLAEKSDGLLELDPKAKPGQLLETHLLLDDRLLNLELTPNRGDCLSVLGTAREVAALYEVPLRLPRIVPAVVESERVLAVDVERSVDCPHYAGRVITDLKPSARTPDWMRERLRRSGIRAIHPVVDITNYVMLELGQPMHAFDLARLQGAIQVRRARAGERLRLLNEQMLGLTQDDLLIADAAKPLVLAGVLGGAESGVVATTTAIFLESACFDPVRVANAGRRYKLLSDSRYRNERGVDPALQRTALERATALVQELCGGKPGPVTEVGRAPDGGPSILLRHARVTQLLGHALPASAIPRLLARLGLHAREEGAGLWRVQVPTWRHDLRLEADLVEEVGRLHGYERIPARAYAAQLPVQTVSEVQRPANTLRDALVARGYQEIVTYSFVDPRLQQALDPQMTALRLDNPIAETMAVMRTNLWSGLVATWQYNRQRQQPRARLFELGNCFLPGAAPADLVQPMRVGGLLAGAAHPEQWGAKSVEADFFDAKADIEAILPAPASEFRFIAARHPALHPGRCAQILRGTEAIGWIGALHPAQVQALDLGGAPILFELDWAAVRVSALPAPQALSEFPSSRRDLSLDLPETVTAEALLAAVRAAAGPTLKEAAVFDLYRGAGVTEGRKSLTLRLIFQDASRTLAIDEIEAAVGEMTAEAVNQLGASVRSR